MEDSKKNDEVTPDVDQDDLHVERIRLENMELRLYIVSHDSCLTQLVHDCIYKFCFLFLRHI